MRLAPGCHRHVPLPVDAPLSDFAAIAERYPVYRIEPARSAGSGPAGAPEAG
jgi:hypothetical protein